MKKSSVQPKMKVKWYQEMNEEIENFVWRKIFRVCFRFSCDTSLTWFQYRLLYRIIGVRKYLATIGKDDCSICRLCTHDEETTIHLFFHCNHSKQLWGSNSTWIKIKIGLLINFKIQDIIFGYLQKDVNYDVINLLGMCTKMYVFQCAVNYNKINIYVFSKKFKSSFYEHLTLLKIKNTNENKFINGLHGSHYLMMYKFEKGNNVTLWCTSSWFTKIN